MARFVWDTAAMRFAWEAPVVLGSSSAREPLMPALTATPDTAAAADVVSAAVSATVLPPGGETRLNVPKQVQANLPSDVRVIKALPRLGIQHIFADCVQLLRAGGKSWRSAVSMVVQEVDSDSMLALLDMAILEARVDLVDVILEAAPSGLQLNVVIPCAISHISLPAAVITCRHPSGVTIEMLRSLRNAGVRFDLPSSIYLNVPAGTTSCNLSIAYEAVSEHNSVSLLAFLAECGADLDLADLMGQTPLWKACSLGKLCLVQYLHRECGASLQTCAQRTGRTWLLNDGSHGGTVAPGSEIVDIRGTLRLPLLHVASLHGHLDTVRYLCSHGGLSVNMLAADGCSPLHLACENGHAEIVRWLHVQGADIEQLYERKTPFTIAYRQGHASVVAYLRSCGAKESIGSGRQAGGHLVPHVGQPIWSDPLDDYVGQNRFTPGSSLPPPKRIVTRPKRSTPMRERAERVGVLDRYRDTPIGLRERCTAGSPAAKKEMQAHKQRNHQIVDRAELKARRDSTLYTARKQADCDGKSARKRKLLLAQ